jgi:hypothetical protein
LLGARVPRPAQEVADLVLQRPPQDQLPSPTGRPSRLDPARGRPRPALRQPHPRRPAAGEGRSVSPGPIGQWASSALPACDTNTSPSAVTSTVTLRPSRCTIKVILARRSCSFSSPQTPRSGDNPAPRKRAAATSCTIRARLPGAMRRTKIVATVSQASRNPEVLVRMTEAGMDVARLNFLARRPALLGWEAVSDGKALERLPEEEYRWCSSWPYVQDVSLKPEGHRSALAPRRGAQGQRLRLAGPADSPVGFRSLFPSRGMPQRARRPLSADHAAAVHLLPAPLVAVKRRRSCRNGG